MAAVALAATALLATACGNVKNPEGWAAPAIDGPEAFVLLDRTHVSAITLEETSGNLEWRFPDGNRLPAQKDIKLKAIYTEPVIDGDAIFFADYEAGVFSLSKADGSINWRFSGAEGKVVGDLGVSDEYISFGTTDGDVYVLRKADGSPAPGWDGGRQFDKGVWAQPIIANDSVFIASMDGSVRALSLEDGSEQWDEPFTVSGAVADLALLDEGHLFVPSLDKSVHILDPATGAELGSYRGDDWVWTTPAYKDGAAYYGDFAGTVRRLNINGGIESAWEYDAEAKVKGGPAIVENVPGEGDVLIVADRDAVVHFLRTDNGQLLNRVPLPEGSGTVRAAVKAAGDRAYIITTEGRLFAAEPAGLRVVEVGIGGR